MPTIPQFAQQLAGYKRPDVSASNRGFVPQPGIMNRDGESYAKGMTPNTGNPAQQVSSVVPQMPTQMPTQQMPALPAAVDPTNMYNATAGMMQDMNKLGTDRYNAMKTEFNSKFPMNGNQQTYHHETSSHNTGTPWQTPPNWMGDIGGNPPPQPAQHTPGNEPGMADTWKQLQQATGMNMPQLQAALFTNNMPDQAKMIAFIQQMLSQMGGAR